MSGNELAKLLKPLYELIAKWREPQEGCEELNHTHDCFCSVFDDCADELQAVVDEISGII